MSIDIFADRPDFFVDPEKNYLEELVGAGKKFTTPEELARGKAESDAHIARLEAEQSALREELATRLKYEEFLDKLNSTPLGTTPPKPADGDTNLDKSSVKPEDLERLVAQKLNQYEAEKAASQNLSLVLSKSQQVLGPNFSQHLKRKTQELGMTEASARQMAATNPKAFFKLFDIEVREQDLFTSPPKNQAMTSPSLHTKVKGDSYYENLRKTLPTNEYFSPKIQNEIYDAIKEMGAEAYYKS